MIAQITGKIESIFENTLNLSVNGICYEVQVPTSVLKNFNGSISRETSVSLITYHYHQVDQSKSIPILIGFMNKIEKDFFEKFITVSGVGPKAAVRALAMPIPDIAQAIDAGDLSYLKSLPGIGEQRAKEIIAKLQGKMGKFGLMKSSQKEGGTCLPAGRGRSSEVEEEAVEILVQLQYKKEEAREMVKRALSRKSDAASAEDILNEVYRQKKAVK